MTTSDASAVSLRRGLVPALSAWLPVFLWAFLIAGMSTDDFGTPKTIVWIDHLLRILWQAVPAELVELANRAVRRLAHLTEYAIFAILLIRALRSGTGPSPSSPLAVAIGVAALLSFADELNQSLTATRSAAFLDCLLDITGACIGAVIVRSRPDATRSVSAG